MPLVACHPGQLNQVFMNLLVNAIQAIAEHGTIRIADRRGRRATVRVDVEDTGSGIAPAHLARIFDPGFTTKGVGVGTGLGLPICHQIVTAHARDDQRGVRTGGRQHVHGPAATRRAGSHVLS